MKITVAICTWNRAKLLDQTLETMKSLIVPPDVEWEVLVVDNNSTDETQAVLARHRAAGLLPLRSLIEPKQGHSNARNAAIDTAKGELIVWTDDDVHVDANWLAAYVEAVRTWPDAAFFGGPIVPWYESSPPAWVARHLDLLGGPFALVNYGPGTRPLTAGEGVVGANMAYRSWVFEGVRFDARLGRQGSQLIGCDETAVYRRLLADGHIGVWVGNATVNHFVPTARMTSQFVWDWFEASGRSEVRLEPPPPASTLFGAPRWAVRRYLSARLRALVRAPLRDRKWMVNFQAAATLLGTIREMSSQPRLAT